MTWRFGLLKALLITSVTACTNNAPKPSQEPKKTAFFVSIDGLQPELVKTLEQTGHLKGERGLDWLLEGSMISSAAHPVITSITAPSHASTITCSPPSRHGIIANNYLKNGKKLNGFAEPFKTEPMWQAAMRQGKKVLSLGYVGTDGTTESRKTTWALAYPLDSLLGRSQVLNWTWTDLPLASGWTTPSELAGRSDLRETVVTVTLNPKTQETRDIQVLLASTPEEGVRLYFGRTKDLTNGTYGMLSTNDTTHPILDFFFTEDHPDSTLKGVKRRVFGRTLTAAPGKVALYLSRASYNQAYPESFRQALDDANLVWPDYGVKDVNLPLAEWVEAQAMIDRFLTSVGLRMIPEFDADIVLFYQPLIDALGHKMQAKLPQPFHPEASDEVSRAFVRSFEIVDDDLSRLFSLPSAAGPKFVMGDHGMDPVEKVINIAQLLPKDHADKVDVFTSGDLAMIYPRQAATDQDAALRLAYEVGQQLKQKLAETVVGGQSVLGFGFKRSDFETPPSKDYTREWQYGDAAWAFAAASHFWLQYQPLKPELLLEPTAYGMHGKAIPSTDMSTMFIAKGPKIPTMELPSMDLIQAVPTFSKLLGIDPPKDCLGTSLLP